MMDSRDACGWQCGALRSAARGSLPSAGDEAPVVIRFGGSLLGRSDWPQRAAATLELPFPGGSASGARTLVVGGGSVVEGLRDIARIRPVDLSLVHRLAIDGMGITARLVATTLGLPLVSRPGGRHAVLDMAAWLADAPERAATIPSSWSVTSDSLAAVVAAAGGAALLLVKSVPPPAHEASLGPVGFAPLAAQGWVDGWFPTAAAAVTRIGWAAPAP